MSNARSQQQQDLYSTIETLIVNKYYSKAYALLNPENIDIKCLFNKQPRKNRFRLICFAKYCLTIGDFNTAQLIHQSIPLWNQDSLILEHIGQYHQEAKNFRLAAQTYLEILNIDKHKDNSVILLDLAYCYTMMSRFDLAIETYLRIPNHQQDANTLSLLSLCYEKLGNLQSAKKMLQSILLLDEQNDSKQQACLNLVRLHKSLREFDSAKAILDAQLAQDPNNIKFLYSLAYLHERTENLEEAERIFLYILNTFGQEKEALVSLGRLYEIMGKLHLAERSYTTIPDYRNDKAVLISLGRCYQLMGELGPAITAFTSIANWLKDRDALLALACCFEVFGQIGQAEIYYKKMINAEPQRIDSYILFGKFLLNKNPQRLKFFLPQYLKKWENSPKLLLLQVEAERVLGNDNEAFTLLVKLIEKYPRLHKGYQLLICHHLKYGDIMEAEAAFSLCLQLFHGDNAFLSRLKKLIRSAEEREKEKTFSPSLNCYPSLKIALPQSILAIFQYISDLPGEHYFVGSSLCSILNGHMPAPHQDVDLVITQDCSEELKKRFNQNRNLPFLFSGNINGIKVDCVIRESDYTPDYTIAGIYCDRNGKVYDPHSGLNDLRNKILRTVNEPHLCFKDDPIRFLRGIFLMVKLGYTPTGGVRNAMFHWKEPENGIDFAHLSAVARKHWQRCTPHEKIHYLNFFSQSGLLTKLFGLHWAPDLTKSYEQVIYATVPKTQLYASNNTFFPLPQKTTEAAGTSILNYQLLSESKDSLKYAPPGL